MSSLPPGHTPLHDVGIEGLCASYAKIEQKENDREKMKQDVEEKRNGLETNKAALSIL